MNTDSNIQVQEKSWTVVVYGGFGYGCGNSYEEAVQNVPEKVGFDGTQYHSIARFTEPIKNLKVRGGSFPWSYDWVDVEGDCVTEEVC